MCCEKCTVGGIATAYGKKMCATVPPEERHLLLCPKISGFNKGIDRIMWGVCRATNALEKVECCDRCDFFS